MLKRSSHPAQAASFPSGSPIEIEVIDVHRVHVMLDTGHPLEFDFEKGKKDFYAVDDKELVVTLGERTIRIARHRILYTDEYPAQLKRSVKPITSEQLAALQESR